MRVRGEEEYVYKKRLMVVQEAVRWIDMIKVR